MVKKEKQSAGKEKQKSRLKKIIHNIHLWLGFTSGLVVFIIAVTGCIYAFQDEIQDLSQSYRFVEPQDKNFLPPSRIQQIADPQLPGKHIHAVLYQGQDRAAKAIYYSGPEKYYYFVYINQYSGEVLKVFDVNSSFFHFILDGHFYLWLPKDIGQPIIASATLVFVIMLISGLFLWWPKKKSDSKKRFRIKWNARWRRKNYDLHNVLGFYISFIAIILALTGLVWGFKWFANGVYTIASGGKEYLKYSEPASDTTNIALNAAIPAVDKVWLKMAKEYSIDSEIEVHPPETHSSPIAANANPDIGTYWKRDFRYFDQFTMKELSVKHTWGRFDDATGADKLMRMNYDIHTGAVFGLAGKFLAFFASLLIASLPVTGFLVWYGRKFKDNTKPLPKKYQSTTAKQPEYSVLN